MAACGNEPLGPIERGRKSLRLLVLQLLLQCRQVLSLLHVDMLAQLGPERLEGRQEIRIVGLEALEFKQVVFDLLASVCQYYTNTSDISSWPGESGKRTILCSTRSLSAISVPLMRYRSNAG